MSPPFVRQTFTRFVTSEAGDACARGARPAMQKTEPMTTLHHDEIAQLLVTLPDWHHRGNAIEKRFECGDFDGSMRFVNAVAEAANAQDHHPDISISWNSVTLTLSSHDAGGLTTRDFRLAEAIEAIAPPPKT
jgi:4a-hydroxytetrahydrobiopterin dehydratase